MMEHGTKERWVDAVAGTLVQAGSTFSQRKKEAYRRAIASETNQNAKWVLEQILENAQVAQQGKSPLCDDTGIPHLVLEVGPKACVTGEMLDWIREGVAQGLRRLPGRPMAILGDDGHRLDQSGGLNPDPGGLEPAPIQMLPVPQDVLRLHVLLFGGGPAIRGRTYRVFHRHNVETVLDQIVQWGREAVSELGCSPCTLAVGIGRSQYEAAALMVQAQIYGDYAHPTPMEAEITRRVNEAQIGPLGLGGDCSVLGTFLKVGPQRASGVRIVSLRPCCCFEPRTASVDLLAL